MTNFNEFYNFTARWTNYAVFFYLRNQLKPLKRNQFRKASKMLLNILMRLNPINL